MGKMKGLITESEELNNPMEEPSDEELQDIGVTGLFLGHYLPWDGLSNAEISQSNGFTTFEKNVEGSMVNYENLDNYQTGIHDYFKFLKFGFRANK